MSKSLDNLFYNLDEPTAYSSHVPLQRTSKQSHKYVNAFLENQPVYSKHKQTRYRFPRRRTTGVCVFSHVQADLIDMNEFARENRFKKYCLSMIDCYSRYAFTIPLLNKSGPVVAAALKHCFDNLHMFPTYLITDKGSEFKNKYVKEYLNSRHISLIHPESEIKCAIVERFNRTWQTRLHKYFTHNNTTKWVSICDKLTKAINNTTHRMIRCTPYEIFSGKKLPQEMPVELKKKSPKYKIGDLVRLSQAKEVFQHGYKSRWTSEVFSIIHVNIDQPLSYRLVDSNGEEILGIVYETELVKAV